jgi:hypothetical protein
MLKLVRSLPIKLKESFINDDKILLCSANEEPIGDEEDEPVPPGHLAIWDIKTNEIKNAVKVKGVFGNLFAINEKLCWDLLEYPKIINLENGEIIDKAKEVYSGKQCSSIIHHLDKLPKIAFDRKTKQIAIGFGKQIDLLKYY